VNLTGFIHDTNPGMGPVVSPVDSGNGFGTRVFWTAVIPDGDVQVDAGAGTAEMHVHNLAELDYYSPDGNAALLSLGPTWQTNYFRSTVSFDVVWNGPVTPSLKVRDAADGFAGTFNENEATVTWSETSASGFTFTSNPGNFSTSVPETPGVNGVTAPLNFFAEVGHERNGIFFPVDSSMDAAAPSVLHGNPGQELAVLATSVGQINVNLVSATSVPGGKSAAPQDPPAHYALEQLMRDGDVRHIPAGSPTGANAPAIRAVHDHAFALLMDPGMVSDLFPEVPDLI
jgi:hypothetical protein